MDLTTLVRMRWRLTGAWLWPIFVALTFVDAVIVNELPPAGDSENAVGAWLISAALMLLAVAVGRPILGAAVRRVRGDMPRAVARDYAGVIAALAVSVILAVMGITNHPTVIRDRAALHNASVRAEAWIGTHAPEPFMANVEIMSTIDIQAPRFYRSCVSNVQQTKYYCVVVDLSKPYGRGVKPDGSEPNNVLDQGVN